MKSVSLFFLAVTLTLLEGCAVGPKYSRNIVPMAPADIFKELDGWKTAQPSDQMKRGNWWEIFGDPQLNALEKQVTASNQNLKVAEARFSRGTSPGSVQPVRGISYNFDRPR